MRCGGRLSAPALDMAAGAQAGPAQGSVSSVLSALRGSTPSVRVPGLRQICGSLDPGRQLSRRRCSPKPVPGALRRRLSLVRQPAPMGRRPLHRGWLAQHRSARAPRAVGVAVLALPPPRSPRAISRRCISHSSDRRSGSASASRARQRSAPDWVAAAPWQGSDIRTPHLRQDFRCWASVRGRGRSCWRRSSHEKSRPDCRHRGPASPLVSPPGTPCAQAFCRRRCGTRRACRAP